MIEDESTIHQLLYFENEKTNRNGIKDTILGEKLKIPKRIQYIKTMMKKKIDSSNRYAAKSKKECRE